MSRSKRSPVQQYHDRVAHEYDHIYSDRYWQWHDALTWEYIKPHIPENLTEPIADLGCGTGKWGLRLARSGYHVTCVDISTKMLDVVQRKAREQHLADKLRVVRADLGAALPLPSEHFALALVLGEALCCTAVPARTLKQIQTILKPKGLLIATVDNRLHAIEYYLQKQDVAGLQRFVRDGRTHWLTRDAAEQFELQTFTPGQLIKMLEGAQFEVIELRGKTVLPMRHYRELLEERGAYRRLLQLERKLSREGDALGRAAHMQFVARRC